MTENFYNKYLKYKFKYNSLKDYLEGGKKDKKEKKIRKKKKNGKVGNEDNFVKICKKYLNDKQLLKTNINAKKIYGIGDLQGDYCTFLICLKMAGVIKDEINEDTPINKIKWMGDNKIREKSGITEEMYSEKHIKCTKSGKIIDLVLKLNKSAGEEEKNGGIRLVLGNGDIKGILLNDKYTTMDRQYMDKHAPINDNRNMYESHNAGILPYQEKELPKVIKYYQDDYEGMNELFEYFHRTVLKKVYHKKEFSESKLSGEIFKVGAEFRDFIGCNAYPIITINNNLLFVHGGIINYFIEKLVGKYGNDKDLFDEYNKMVMSYILTGSIEEKFYVEENKKTTNRGMAPMWNNSWGKLKPGNNNNNSGKDDNINKSEKDDNIDKIENNDNINKSEDDDIDKPVNCEDFKKIKILGFSDMIIGHSPQHDKLKYIDANKNEVTGTINSICDNNIHRIDVEMNYRGGKNPPQIIKFKYDKKSKSYEKHYLIYKVDTEKNEDYMNVFNNKFDREKIITIDIVKTIK